MNQGPTSTAGDTLEGKRDALLCALRDLGSVAVAFSGGVDSAVVAQAARIALADRAVAVTAHSPSVAGVERDDAARVAAQIGIRHVIIETDEFASPAYRANDGTRCYHCKSELYDSLSALAARKGYDAVLSGANADDVGDWRPGLRAAAEHLVIHPLLEAGVGKQDVRELARALGVPSADKPASPCLASRIPYGTPVHPAVLQQIDRAELALRRLGFHVLRVRHYGEVGRVELGADELPRALAAPETVVSAVRSAGYSHVEIDEEPFRSGSLNMTFAGRLPRSAL